METLSSSKTQSWLTWFLRGLLLLAFFILIARLADLQIIKGSYFRQLSEGNRIRRVPIESPRGRILARGGEVIAGNLEVKKKVVFNPEEGFSKVKVDSYLNGLGVITEWDRYYKEGSTFAHITGYLGEVGEEELGKIKAQCSEKGPLGLGFLVGRGGLEEEYDCNLRGIDGEELVEVDALGNKVRLLGRKEPTNGNDLKTTIDYSLQKKIVEIINNSEDLTLVRRGAVVVSDTQGEILALYSFPSYDPNIFVSGEDSEKINAILEDEGLPLFNRATGGMYHPGSVYKPIVAIAALEEGVIDEDFIYEDTGIITLETLYGTFSYANWYFSQYGGVEGRIDLVRAIKRSTDTFFYKTGEFLGVENLVSWSSKFNLDQKTGIDIPGEIAGLVPSPEWKMKAKGERWFLGNTYHMSIGQGDIALTPIGVNTAITVIANGGDYCKPRILLDGESGNVKCQMSNVKCSESKHVCVDLGISNESIALVKQGMVGACQPEGTGYTFFDFEEKTGIDVACKTGTAETDDADESTHAWFVAFGPADEPEIVVTVMIEKGGEGSKVAGPIAREIFDYWFEVGGN